jgi:hypothetical protein
MGLERETGSGHLKGTGVKRILEKYHADRREKTSGAGRKLLGDMEMLQEIDISMRVLQTLCQYYSERPQGIGLYIIHLHNHLL